MLLSETNRQRIALFFVYLISSSYATEVANLVSGSGSYSSFFGPPTRLEYDSQGEPIPKEIVKTAPHIPRLQVTNSLYSPMTGSWHQVRSLGGPMAVEWVRMHAGGHPNTTVTWNNGTAVHPHDCHTLLDAHGLAKRWQDSSIELTIWNADAFSIQKRNPIGIVAGFTVATVAFILHQAAKAAKNRQAHASAKATKNNKRRKRNNFEKNVYYVQDLGIQADTKKWPSVSDVQTAVHSALQDMADYDYQGACYDAVTWVPVNGPGEGCPINEFAQLGICTWMDGQKCTTPHCHLRIGQTTECNGLRRAHGQ